MARTIKEIATSIKEAFIKNDMLKSLYGFDASKTFEEQFSDASIETVLIEEFATASATVENLVEIRKSEIDRIVMSERYGYKGWYEVMMKSFQYGDDVNELEEKTYYDVIDESKQIIKYAYCEENSSGILLKVAKESNLQPEVLDTDEYNAAFAYINRVKPAGILVELRNEVSDILTVNVSIKYNPLMFTKDGAQKVVKDEIKNYLKSLEYNGAFVGMTLIDFIQRISGIEIAQIDSVFVQHANWNAEDITAQLSYTPYSGHLILDDSNSVINVE
ncbi:MAG: hypothetical protein LBE13_18695 [Bacteroidales bacterium]|jgi:hypothetical protein|nr:hypothetical protein [Bacteroidales bacterium]